MKKLVLVAVILYIMMMIAVVQANAAPNDYNVLSGVRSFSFQSPDNLMTRDWQSSPSWIDDSAHPRFVGSSL